MRRLSEVCRHANYYYATGLAGMIVKHGTQAERSEGATCARSVVVSLLVH